MNNTEDNFVNETLITGKNTNKDNNNKFFESFNNNSESMSKIVDEHFWEFF